jgi:hypothetical protein
VLAGIIGVVLSLIIIAIPFVMQNKEKWIDKVRDEFAKGNLSADVHWHWFDGIGGLILLAGLLTYFTAKIQPVKTILFFSSVTLCCFITAVLIVPKIEAISQRANIEFFEARRGEDCYVETVHYKSYAQYFYSREMPSKNKESANIDWLLKGHIDKPAYFSTRIQYKAGIDTLPGLVFLYQKNGFVFYKRLPPVIIK